MYHCNSCGTSFYHQQALAKHLAICMFNASNANPSYFPAPPARGNGGPSRPAGRPGYRQGGQLVYNRPSVSNYKSRQLRVSANRSTQKPAKGKCRGIACQLVCFVHIAFAGNILREGSSLYQLTCKRSTLSIFSSQLQPHRNNYHNRIPAQNAQLGSPPR